MAKLRARSPQLAILWFHLATLFGLLLAGGGLFLGAWALFAREQADRRAMLNLLYYRAIHGVPSTSGDPNARAAYVPRAADKLNVDWVGLVGGALLFSAGGYLAGVGLLSINRRALAPRGHPAEPAPGWVGEPLERMGRGEGPESP